MKIFRYNRQKGTGNRMLEYIKGMDVSSMDEIEQLGAVFYDEGKQGDLLEILKKYGSNYIRLRLWNDPLSLIHT